MRERELSGIALRFTRKVRSMVWTHFWDMHSGGDLKVSPFDHIYIEASERDAMSVFYARFGFNPHRISCSCCGEDYSVSEYKTFKEASCFQRGDRISKLQPEPTNITSVKDYKKQEDVKVIRAKEIVDTEKSHVLHEEGWVWK